MSPASPDVTAQRELRLRLQAMPIAHLPPRTEKDTLMSRCSGKSTRSRLRVITALIEPGSSSSARILHLSATAFLAAHNKRAVAVYLEGIGLAHECEHSFNAIFFKPTGRIVRFAVEDVTRWGHDGIPPGMARPDDTIERDV